MRSLSTMKATYLRKLTALYTGTTLASAVSKMADDYANRMASLRDKQLLAKDVMQQDGISSGRQAGFQMLTNAFWRLQVIQAYGGATETQEFAAVFAYLKAKYAWGSGESPTGQNIASQVFSVTIP